MGKSCLIFPCFGVRSKKDKLSDAANIPNGSYNHLNGKDPPLANGHLKKASLVKTESRNSNRYANLRRSSKNRSGRQHVEPAAAEEVIPTSQFVADWQRPEVLELVLARTPIASLLNCRAVCKSWCKESSRLLRLNESFCNTIPVTHLREFTQTMSKSFDNPMQSYQFHVSSMRHPDLRFFFGQLGHTIVSLDLTLLISETEAFFNILPWMPNLMELMLILFYNDNQPPPGIAITPRKEGEKPVLTVRLVDADIIKYIENTKTLIYCNYELKICQKELESKQFSLNSQTLCIEPVKTEVYECQEAVAAL